MHEVILQAIHLRKKSLENFLNEYVEEIPEGFSKGIHAAIFEGIFARFS